MSRIKSRRLTAKSVQSSFEDDVEEVSGDSTNKNITFDQEDILISIILRHFDAIESLENESSEIASAWDGIAAEFNDRTRVRFELIFFK